MSCVTGNKMVFIISYFVLSSCSFVWRAWLVYSDRALVCNGSQRVAERGFSSGQGDSMLWVLAPHHTVLGTWTSYVMQKGFPCGYYGVSYGNRSIVLVMRCDQITFKKSLVIWYCEDDPIPPEELMLTGEIDSLL